MVEMTIFVEPSLALQAALRTRLATSASITNLVPADSIRSDWAHPEKCPCIILGDGYLVDESKSYPRRHVRVFSDIHIWTAETGMSSVKSISGAIDAKLRNTRPTFSYSTPFRCIDANISMTRYIRDIDGKRAHGIITFQALMELPAWNDTASGDWEDDLNWFIL